MIVLGYCTSIKKHTTDLLLLCDGALIVATLK